MIDSRGLNWKAMLSPQVDAFAHEDSGPKLLVHTFKTRCHDSPRIAESRVVHALHRAEVADDRLPDMNANPCEEWRQAHQLRTER